MSLYEIQVIGVRPAVKIDGHRIVIPKLSSGIIRTGQSLKSKNGKVQAVMQTDGNFVVYCLIGKDKVPVWATNTDGKKIANGVQLQVIQVDV